MVSPTPEQAERIYADYLEYTAEQYIKAHPTVKKPGYVKDHLHNELQAQGNTAAGLRTMLVKRNFDPFIESHITKVRDEQRVDLLGKAVELFETVDQYERAAPEERASIEIGVRDVENLNDAWKRFAPPAMDAMQPNWDKIVKEGKLRRFLSNRLFAAKWYL